MGKMKVDLYSLQRHTIESYNQLVNLLNKSKRDDGTVSVNGETLERILSDLHNNIATVGSLIDPDTGASYLDGTEAKMNFFEFEPSGKPEPWHEGVEEQKRLERMLDQF